MGATENGRLSAAVIGVGRISEQHLRFLAKSHRARLLAVCDLSPALVSFAAERFGATHALTDYHQMLKAHRPQVVHILTPPHTHAAIASDCLAANAHVIVEKPVTTSRTEFKELQGLVQSSGRYLIEDHNYRFNQPILQIEQMIASERLGQVREIEVRMALQVRGPGFAYADKNIPHPSHRLPAGVIHEFLTHLCYLALHFLPDDELAGGFERVEAIWSNHGGAGAAQFKYDDLDALLVCGGAHARIRFSSTTWPESLCITVRGTQGTVSTDLFQPHLRVEVGRIGGAQLTPLLNQCVNGIQLAGAGLRNFSNKVLQRTPLEGLSTFLRLTYAALASGDEPPVSLENMDRCNQLIELLLDKAEQS